MPLRLALILVLTVASTPLPGFAQMPADVLTTKHNLSVTGPGTVRALTETRVCIFCHTPHNATPLSPLWNKEIEPQVYTVYASPTSRLGPLPQPSGPTKLCLSCHDGTIAMGAVLNPAGGIQMASGDILPAESLSNFGLDLSGHHPVSFPYQNALPNAELVPVPPADLTFGANDEVHCTTCHDPHNDINGRFLTKDNRYSALCISCHQITGWTTSAHATSTASVVGVLPRPPKTWPTYTQLNEWGCEVCHTPHFAPTAAELLNFTTTGVNPFTCTSAGCHSSEPPPPHEGTVSAPAAAAMTTGLRMATFRPGFMADIAAQSRKPSAHHQIPGMPLTSFRTPGRANSSVLRGVNCMDCHNAHLATGEQTEAPYVSGMMRGVSGVDRNGVEIDVARYEYEVCFKCHADNTPDFSYVPRVKNNTNNRLDFDPNNSSFHPIEAIGKNPNVPSIPSSLTPSLTPFDFIYCKDCHADDESDAPVQATGAGGYSLRANATPGARRSGGPHGSSFPPILRDRYETTDGTAESFDSYALCYRCHERNSILDNRSFHQKRIKTTPSGGGHRGHLDAGATCSECHDPHGVFDWGVGAMPSLPLPQSGGAGTGTAATGGVVSAGGGGGGGIGGSVGATGSHTNLINFDTRIVAPRSGAQYPIFIDTGVFSGRCSLVCHGVDHDNWSYP